MADEEIKEGEGEQPEAKVKSGKKKSLLFGGGAVAVVATGAIVAVLAAPSKTETPRFQGPFVMALADETTSIQVNLAGGSSRRYLVMDLRVEYDAYKEQYGASRIADPLYLARLQDTLLTVCAQKSAEEVLERGSQEIFLQELRTAVEPLLFPVHIGETKSPTDTDEKSGLRPGLSMFEATMRDPITEATLFVDEPEQTLTLNGGEPFEFLGHEENLVVRDERGLAVYIDVTSIKPDFVGEVPVGVKGRVRALYKMKFIIQ